MLKFTHLTNNKYTVYMNMFVNPINWLPSLKRRLKIHTNQHSFWLIIIYDNKMPTYKNILKIKVTKLKHKQIQRTSWQHSYICSINKYLKNYLWFSKIDDPALVLYNSLQSPNQTIQSKLCPLLNVDALILWKSATFSKPTPRNSPLQYH